ncbi:MAG: helix-turn-helix transcriptional regulator [Lachnospiraceae bacterium]|jgi:transcriptional regulator with XRE-family HTH domain|nr:helix-turn-helix transcriptional regulator [Lachnospiraceae bacterium]MCI9680405.1 helix-turn-helix transcriptional regulator [Lachnospiraceae bacterium]
MTFAEKLKSIRKQAGMSQEQLAEKLGVSRQAVTKWETNGGIPDIENIMAISALFGISIDELLMGENGGKKSADFSVTAEWQKGISEEGYLFESITEYDIDEPKRCDMKFGGAKKFILSGYEGEKLRICLASNTLSTLQNDFKVKIDDIRKRIDVDVNRRNGVSEASAKEAVSIFVQIPSLYARKIECAVNAETVEIRALECESIELDVKTPNIILADVSGAVEIDCNLDMEVVCYSLKGEVAINQVSATSKIHIPEDTVFTAVAKGIKTSISYEREGRQAERFDTPDAENIIELNGIKSELVICADGKKECHTYL